MLTQKIGHCKSFEHTANSKRTSVLFWSGTFMALWKTADDEFIPNLREKIKSRPKIFFLHFAMPPKMS